MGVVQMSTHVLGESVTSAIVNDPESAATLLRWDTMLRKPRFIKRTATGVLEHPEHWKLSVLPEMRMMLEEAVRERSWCARLGSECWIIDTVLRDEDGYGIVTATLPQRGTADLRGQTIRIRAHRLSWLIDHCHDWDVFPDGDDD